MRVTIILTILATPFILLGCEEAEWRNDEYKLNLKTEKRVYNIKKGDYEVLVIERCQYILYQEREGVSMAYGYMSHKGSITLCTVANHLTLSLIQQKYHIK